ncbi:MAG: hypothetical protein ABWY00_16630 [Dongiaceae bacterium]
MNKGIRHCYLLLPIARVTIASRSFSIHHGARRYHDRKGQYRCRNADFCACETDRHNKVIGSNSSICAGNHCRAQPVFPVLLLFILFTQEVYMGNQNPQNPGERPRDPQKQQTQQQPQRPGQQQHDQKDPNRQQQMGNPQDRDRDQKKRDS